MTVSCGSISGRAAENRFAWNREVLRELARAWWQIRILRHSDLAVLLPPVRAGAATPCDPEDVWRQVDRLARRVVFWKVNTYCFYRSFAVAVLLRRRGVPARLDFGLRLAGGRRRQCHCWVSIRGRSLGEDTGLIRSFPVDLGGRGDDVHYWLADGAAES